MDQRTEDQRPQDPSPRDERPGRADGDRPGGDQRSHYRVRALPDSMRVTLRTDEGSVEGGLLDLSIRGAGARFDPAAMPAAMPGDRVRLEFRALLLLEPLATEAIVRRVDAVGGELRVGFEFADPRAVLRDVPYVLRPYFNRRRHPRVEIPEAVEVEVVAPGVRCSGRLRQLGLGGAMVSLPMEPASQLGRGDRLELRFALPERPEPFWFLAVVRGLSQAGDELGCSLRFDRAGTVGFEEQRDAVTEIVAMRLAELDEAEAAGEARGPGSA